MASKVEIINVALQKIGAMTITTPTLIESPTDSAKKIDVVYDIILDEVLSAGAWSSTLFQAELSRDVATPLFDFSYQYHLPTDPFCLKVVRFNGAYGNKALTYAIKRNFLQTNEETAQIEYVGRVSETELFGVYLTNTFILRLALEIVIPITKSRSLRDDLLTDYKAVLAENLLLDGQQGSYPTYSFNSDAEEIRSYA